jgi:hypothetical protein
MADHHTQYLHTAKYGNPGGVHTMKPMYKKVDNHIYKSEYHPDVIANKEEGLKAIYHVRDNKIYASAAHPDGPSPHAIFKIAANGLIHTTHDHPEHQSDLPVFVMNHRPDPEFIKKTVAAEAPPTQKPASSAPPKPVSPPKPAPLPPPSRA